MDCLLCKRRPTGFTVLELLVVTAICGLLIGLLLPALMAAREAGRRVVCAGNLWQLGLAVQMHHETADRLPVACTLTGDRSTGYGWAVPLLPYLEQANDFPNVSLASPWAAADDPSPPRYPNLSVMRCPSDISEDTFDLLPDPKLAIAGHATRNQSSPANGFPLVTGLPTANYVGVFGTLEADDSFPPPAGEGAIVFHCRVRFADLERGLTNTLLLGERTTAMVPSTWLGIDFRGEDAGCRLVGSAITTPNCQLCDECEFGSRHPGGSHFLWADGHVSLLPASIDTAVYQRLTLRSRTPN